MYLLGFAGALHSELVVWLDVEHVTWIRCGLKLLIERSKRDALGGAADTAIPSARVDGNLPAGHWRGRSAPMACALGSSSMASRTKKLWITLGIAA